MITGSSAMETTATDRVAPANPTIAATKVRHHVLQACAVVGKPRDNALKQVYMGDYDRSFDRPRGIIGRHSRYDFSVTRSLMEAGAGTSNVLSPSGISRMSRSLSSRDTAFKINKPKTSCA